MPPPFDLESFDSQRREPATVFFPADRLDSLRSEARALGYQEGFDAAQKQLDAARIESTKSLVAELDSISLTQEQARKAVLETLQPLIESMVDIVLPTISSAAITELVSTQIMILARRGIDQPLELRCAPENAEETRGIIADMSELSVSVTVYPDPAISGSDIVIQSAHQEVQIVPEAALLSLKKSIVSFYSHIKDATPNG